MHDDLVLTRLNRCRNLLAECTTVDKTMQVIHAVDVVAIYAKRSKATLGVINRAHAYKLILEGKLGLCLERAKKNGELHPGHPKKRMVDSNDHSFSLKQKGISKDLSSRAQRLAKVPEEVIHRASSVATAKEEMLSARAVLDPIKRKSESIKELPPGKFSVIYADPPWRYDEGSIDPSRNIENQYPTLSLDEIKAIPVLSLAAKDCVLFLWAPPPKIEEALGVMSAWGFCYRTAAVWDKEHIGPGYYFRSQFETLLLGIVGRPGTPAPSDRISSYYREARTKHSRKPIYFRNAIERMYPHAKRIEMFARESSPDWVAWGNEIKCSRARARPTGWRGATKFQHQRSKKR